VAVIAEVLGREVRYVELGRDEMTARRREQGYSENNDIDFFLPMRTRPPKAARRTALPTAEAVTGRPGTDLRPGGTGERGGLRRLTPFGDTPVPDAAERSPHIPVTKPSTSGSAAVSGQR
jgi:hypothetical protein